MIKSLVFGAAAGALALAPLSATANPYINVENNAGYSGGDYLGATTDFHVGFEGADGVYSYYAQGGPAFVSPQGEDGEFELSGKVGGNVQVAESVGIYGELSFLTAEEDPSVGTKLGVKWAF